VSLVGLRVLHGLEGLLKEYRKHPDGSPGVVTS
jgi:hypothetical protein